MLACQWARLAEEEAFAGRCAEAGDELGSIVIVARQARHLIRLWLLMERRYPPYSKWLGRALATTSHDGVSHDQAGRDGIGPLLLGALTAAAWPDRERPLTAAYEAAARRHNELGLTAPLATGAGPYYTRPYLVLGGDRFAAALLEEASPTPPWPRCRRAARPARFTDSVGILGDLTRLRALVSTQLARQ